MKKVLIAAVVILFVLFIIGSLSDSDESKTQPEDSIATESESEITDMTAGKTTEEIAEESSESREMELTMLDVGQGLSILGKADGEWFIYDGGGRDTSSYVVSYLKQHNVDKLSAVFASHYDEDHIAGLVGVLNTIKVDKVICPDYESDATIYNSFIKKIEEHSVTVEHPDIGRAYKIGRADIRVLTSKECDTKNENNNSLAVKITYGKFSCVITGDAEKDAEDYIVRNNDGLSSTLLVVGHHGASTSTTDVFLRRVSPKYAFISCGKDNDYGHPSASVLDLLKSRNVQLFRSDIQGEVTCTTDGKAYWFSKEPCNDFTPGVTQTPTKIVIDTTKAPSAEEDFVDQTTKKVEQTTKKPEPTSKKDEQTTKKADSATKPVEKATKKAVHTTQSIEYKDSYYFVLNKDSKVFHYSECSRVKVMSDKNKGDFYGTREEAIAAGYSPCGICHP